MNPRRAPTCSTGSPLVLDLFILHPFTSHTRTRVTQPCPCQSADADAAYSALRARVPVVELVDESHLGVRVFRCRACNAAFLSVFTELIDWSGGDDAQAWMVAPLTEGEASALGAPGAQASLWRTLLASRAADRPYLARVYPRGGAPSVTWRTGPVPILPHD